MKQKAPLDFEGLFNATIFRFLPEIKRGEIFCLDKNIPATPYPMPIAASIIFRQ